MQISIKNAEIPGYFYYTFTYQACKLYFKEDPHGRKAHWGKMQEKYHKSVTVYMQIIAN